MQQQFAVFGNPIAHSKSPSIHQHFAQQFGLEIDYQKRLSTAEQFATDVMEFFSSGGLGCNVTVPFKEDAYAMCQTLTPPATRAKAVNTLFVNKEKQLCGHNTDGIGLVNDLLNHQLDIKARHLLVVGAGGATRGILGPIIEQQPASITLANRTYHKARNLAAEFDDLFAIHTSATEQLDVAHKPDLIINATSASLSAEVPISDISLLSKHTACYDLAYATEPTAFMQWAHNNGCDQTLDGRGMLIEQAAAAFFTWTRLQPDTAAINADFASR